MIFLYNTIIYNPLLNALVFFYQTIAFHDLGVAIIILTICIRLLLFPLFQKSTRYQIVMQALQPKIKKIQEDFKHDKKKQSEAMMEAYKEYGMNPFSGFLFLLVQLPILIALYHIFLNIFSPEVFQNVYSFIIPPATLNVTFLGLLNLKEQSILVVVLAAAAQYWQTRMLFAAQRKDGHTLTQAERMTQRMAIIGPVITIVIFFGLPSAVGLYWLVSSLFSIIQQGIVNKQLSHGTLGTIHKKNT